MVEYKKFGSVESFLALYWIAGQANLGSVDALGLERFVGGVVVIEML